MARKIASLPRAADRAELELLLRLLDWRIVNLLLSGIPKPFTGMSPAQRERCLREEWLARVDAAGWGANQLLLVTFHQMASCRMGASARTSVVDAEHRVWGIRGLYVADASVFPSASGVNPMLTVMAIAHRAARAIATHLS